jgi:hypothetical protein
MKDAKKKKKERYYIENSPDVSKKSTKSKVRMAGDQTNVSAQAVPKTKYNIRQNRV